MEDDDDKGELENSPAIKALGPLFKLTEVHFWVDLCTGMPYGSTSMESSKTVTDDGNSCVSESISSHIDAELSRQMNELGLPLSFSTNKEKHKGKVKAKRKDAYKKASHTYEDTTYEVSDVVNKEFGDIHADENKENSNNGCLEERLEDPLIANQTSEVEQICSNINIELNSLLHDNCDPIHNGCNAECGDWLTYWDEFYERNYYYNYKTEESTWDPPPGMEHLASVYVPNESKETAITSSKMDDNTDATKIEFNAVPNKRKKK